MHFKPHLNFPGVLARYNHPTLPKEFDSMTNMQPSWTHPRIKNSIFSFHTLTKSHYKIDKQKE